MLVIGVVGIRARVVVGGGVVVVLGVVGSVDVVVVEIVVGVGGSVVVVFEVWFVQ